MNATSIAPLFLKHQASGKESRVWLTNEGCAKKRPGITLVKGMQMCGDIDSQGLRA